MEKLISVRDTEVIPMTRKEYNLYRGWVLPADERGEDKGYLLKTILPDGEEYINWVTKKVFNYLYNKKTNLTFSEVKIWLDRGYKAYRKNWNGNKLPKENDEPNMFIFKVPSSHFKVNRPPLLGIYEEGKEIDYHSHIDMKTADGYIVPWIITQTDLEAIDWCVCK